MVTAGGRYASRRVLALVPGAGVCALLLLGQGVLGQITDVVRVDDNQITSNALIVDESGLVIGLGLDGVCPDDTPYGTEPLTGLVLELDAASGPGQGTGLDICVRNDTAAPVTTTMTVAVTSDGEVGACESSESEAGDTTCTDGAAGEIVAATTLLRSSRCTGVEATGPLAQGATPYGVGTLDPGEVCYVRVEVQVDGSPALWQTDRATFDILIEGV